MVESVRMMRTYNQWRVPVPPVGFTRRRLRLYADRFSTAPIITYQIAMLRLSKYKVGIQWINLCLKTVASLCYT